MKYSSIQQTRQQSITIQQIQQMYAEQRQPEINAKLQHHSHLCISSLLSQLQQFLQLIEFKALFIYEANKIQLIIIFYLYSFIQFIQIKDKMDWTNQLTKVNNKFKFQLFGRNVENLDSCYANIIKFDQNYQGTMTQHAFSLYLNSFGVFLTVQEIRTIKQGFLSGNGQIKYIDFIQNVRDDISPKRLATIDHAWDELSNGEVINIESLLSGYDANNHPHARCHVKPPQKIYDQFQHSIKNRSADKINLNNIQFKEYYLDVNACVPTEREEYFVDIIIKGLRLDDARVSVDRLRQMEVVLYQKLRQKTYIKKDQGIRLQQIFRFFDMEDKGIIDFKRFMSVLDKLGCNFSQKQTKALYQKHARQDMLLSYEQFCGMMFSMGSGLKDNQNPIFQLAKKDGLVTTQGMSKRLN